MSDSRKVLGPEAGANATAQRAAHGLFLSQVPTCLPPSPALGRPPSECKPSVLSSSRVWHTEVLLHTPAGQTDGWKEEEQPCCFPSSFQPSRDLSVWDSSVFFSLKIGDRVTYFHC